MLPSHVTRKQLEAESSVYRSLVKFESVQSDDLRANFTLATFLSLENGESISSISPKTHSNNESNVIS